jgi:hypothetical protein
MTVIKLADDAMFVHSPVRLDEVTRAVWTRNTSARRIASFVCPELSEELPRRAIILWNPWRRSKHSGPKSADTLPTEAVWGYKPIGSDRRKEILIHA